MVHSPSRSAALLSLILWPSHPGGGRTPPWAVPGSLFWEHGMCVLLWAGPQSVISSHPSHPIPTHFWDGRRRWIKPSIVGFLPDHRGAAQHFDTWSLLVSTCFEITGCTGIPVCLSRCGPQVMSSDPALLLGKSLGGLNPPCCRALPGESTEGCKHELVLKAPGDNTCGNLAAKWNSLVVN